MKKKMSREKTKLEKTPAQLKRREERKNISYKGDKAKVNCNGMNLNPHIFTITLYANMLHLKDRNCQDRYNRKNFSPEKQWTNEGHPSMKLRKQKTCTNESMLGFNLYGVLKEGKLKE